MALYSPEKGRRTLTSKLCANRQYKYSATLFVKLAPIKPPGPITGANLSGQAFGVRLAHCLEATGSGNGTPALFAFIARTQMF